MDIPRASLISSEQSRKLSRRSPLALALHLGFDYAVIISAAVLCEIYWSIPLYVLVVMIIGARMVGIGSVAIHDGVHRLLARDRRLNDRIGKLLGLSVGVPLVADYDEYRDSHFKHHRNTNMEDAPEAWVPEKFYDFPRWQGALVLLSAISGLLFLRILIAFISRHWKWSIPAIFAIGVAVWFSFYPATLFVLYWLVPFATWGLFVNLVRALAEHYPENVFEVDVRAPEVFRTRDILNSWFDRIFVATRGVNFHLSHHLVANVPFYRLPELQRVLAQSEPYRKYAHVTRGYHRFFIEYFLRRACLSPSQTETQGVNRFSFTTR